VTLSVGYLRTFFSTLAVWLVGATLLNGLVDPFDAYQLLGNDTSLDDYKKMRGSRIYKAEMITRHPCNTLILGTSRTLAFDAESPHWENDEVYNAGLAAANLSETFHVFQYALKHADVRRVLFCAEPNSFSSEVRYPDEFTLSRFDPDRSEAAYHIDNLISLRTTLLSLKVVSDFVIDNRAQFSRLGNRNEFAKSRRHRTRSLFAKQLTLDVNSLAFMPYTWEGLDLLRQMVEDCRCRDIELIVIIPPYHALHLEAMWAVGQWKTFESWKRDVVSLFADNPYHRAALWDFSGYNRFTTEAVPQNDNRDTMQWYWESSHFKRTLGEKIIQRVIRGDGDGDGTTFGVQLTASNIDDHLARIRSERQHWLPHHSQDADWVLDTADRVLKRYNRVATRPTLRQ